MTESEREAALPVEDWQWLADQLRAWPMRRVHPDRTMCDGALRRMAADVIEDALDRPPVPMHHDQIATGLASDWVMVPREPTEAMVDRFVSRALCVSVCNETGGWSGYAREQWRAMLAAAPSEPLP